MSEVQDAAIHQQAYPIFVYGTLRPKGGRHEVVQKFIAEQGVYPATVDGYQIYLFDAFPGAVKEEGAVGLVGDILVINGERYAEAIERLDRYEVVGFLYNRVIVQAKLLAHAIPCWFYEIREEEMRASREGRIASNDWLKR